MIGEANFMKMICSDDNHDLNTEINTSNYKKGTCKKCGVIVEEWKKECLMKRVGEAAFNGMMIILFFLVPILLGAAVWLLLDPSGFWEKFAMFIFELIFVPIAFLLFVWAVT